MPKSSKNRKHLPKHKVQRRSKQQAFDQRFTTDERAFGGTLLKDKANRGARPIAVKKPMHMVLRSTQAVGKQSFLSPRKVKRVEAIIRKFALKNGVKIYQIGNAGNHLHILLQVGNRYLWNGFIRGLTSALAYAVTATEKGNSTNETAAKVSKHPAKRFWDFRPFTRVVEWGRDFLLQKDYAMLNTLEGMGILPPRHTRNKVNCAKDPTLWRRVVHGEWAALHGR